MTQFERIAIGILVPVIVINFFFDWWRRHDFENERKVLNDLSTTVASRLEESRDLSDSVLRDTADRLNGLDEIYRTLLSAIGKLSQDAEGSAQQVGAAPPPSKTSPGGAPEDPRGDTDKPEQLLNLPLDYMQQRIEENRAVQWRFELTSRFSLQNPDKWETEGLVEAVQEQFGVVLSDNDRQLVETRVEIYRSVAKAAEAIWDAHMRLSTFDRIGRGEFEKAAADGSFHEDATIDPKEVFTVSLAGDKRFRWSKSRHPAEYRDVVNIRYVPVAMVGDLVRFFEER